MVLSQVKLYEWLLGKIKIFELQVYFAIKQIVSQDYFLSQKV